MNDQTKNNNKDRIYFDIEERANGKWKVVKYKGVIYGFYKSYRRLKKDFPRLRKFVRNFPPENKTQAQ